MSIFLLYMTRKGLLQQYNSFAKQKIMIDLLYVQQMLFTAYFFKQTFATNIKRVPYRTLYS